jgi:non-lysosomal glucosylceramidase
VPKGRLNFETWKRTLAESTPRREYIGDDLRCVAMPLGGVGTGSIALCGDGSLRQWQVVNQINHIGYVPHSFFAVWTSQPGHPPLAKVLQTKRFLRNEGFQPAASVSDHLVPAAMARWLSDMPCVEETRFYGEYPLAFITYHDDALPVAVELEAHSPFVPFDAEASGIPAILFHFKVKSRVRTPLRAALMGSLQNFVGWDGVSLIHGVQNPGFGSNQNRLHRVPGCPVLEMISSQLADDHPFWGQLALAVFADNVTALSQWDDLAGMWHDFVQDGVFPSVADISPSAPWRTWNGSLSAAFTLEPGEEKELTFVLVWYFPNRYVNWRQPAMVIDDSRSRFYLGNSYNRFGSALHVLQNVSANVDATRAAAARFRETFYSSSQPYWFLDAVTANIAPARTNITFWTESGEFHGFEGGCGASTSGGTYEVGGSCPLDCTHVWNYEMTIARLWPDLDRSMRRTDWLVNQHPSGYLPHRTPLPAYLPRLWDMEIGGPSKPAVDGLFGGVLKTCREFLACGDPEFLDQMAPHVFKAMEYAMTHHDTEGDGVIKGDQPNTYDISLYGPNTFIGSLYLAALLAAARLADAAGKPELAAVYRERCAAGSEAYDRICWNGEYYEQVVDLAKHSQYQLGGGCMADQVLGQWWAHLLGLGYVLPQQHVRGALKSVWQYNFRDGFEGFKQQPRVFASEHDRGLLNATYPKGDRPRVPLLYSDEVWTGVEYAVGALMIYEGLLAEGLAVVRAARDRYDGYERNPWNEVECGDHYVRPMSSWSLIDLSLGLVYEADRARIRFSPRWPVREFAGFFGASTAYGLYRQVINQSDMTGRIELAQGELRLSEVVLSCPGRKAEGSVRLGTKAVGARLKRVGPDVTVTFDEPLGIGRRRRLEIRLDL